jgi:hypothetical protein
MSDRPLRVAGVRLFIASFVVLAQELALIRWLPSQVRVLAYFPNVVLLSAFLGLGVGCLLARRAIALYFWSASLLLVTIAAAAMSGIIFTQRSTTEHLWLLYFDLPPGSPIVHGIRIPILTLFVLSAVSFVPLGHFVARQLVTFREHGRPLWGYACDLAGSLTGVVTFALLSFRGTFPPTWFAVILGAGLLLTIREARTLVVHLACCVAILTIVVRFERAQMYSPYYALAVRPQPAGYLQILANGSQHQLALPLQRGNSPRFEPLYSGYHLPYRLLGRQPRRVLVLGAGSGNDVAVALDEGAQHIDAVEIDPQIFRIGRMHPNRPYASPRVRMINTDARAFLNDSREKYDLIVFGTLDSMTRLSALSNVRLDNFVYTVECARAARNHLTPDGGLVMYFMVTTDYIDQHIASMLARAMEERPTVIRHNFQMFTRIYLAGPAFQRLMPQQERLTPQEARSRVVGDVPTDDWPFLYLQSRGISSFYLSVIAAILAITAVAVFGASPDMRQSLASGGFDAEMFLFGLAFLMIETKLVTEMNLVWGATWLTSAVVFGAILLMVLLSTLLMDIAPLPWNVSAPALVASLLFTYLLPVRMLVGRSLTPRLLLSIIFIGLPVFFASACFAILFRSRERPDVAFGWNMLGAVVGGVLEFSSMAIGIKATTLLALAAYLVAMYARQRRLALLSTDLAEERLA